MNREQILTDTLAEMTDSLVENFDVLDVFSLLVERSVELLGVSAAGLLLDNGHGGLQVMASTSEAMQLVEVFQVQAEEGPCRDCFVSGEPVMIDDLAAEAGRWPEFVPVALRRGFRAAHALPMHLHGRVLGVLGLFGEIPGGLEDQVVRTGQALADMGTVAILHERRSNDAQLLASQLQQVLNSRIAIEQAKGIVAQHFGLDPEAAYHRLRGYARGHQLGLSVLGRQVVTGALAVDAFD